MPFKSTEIATIAVAGVALIGSVVSAFYTYANRNRELDIKLVEIGIGILRTDPKGTDLASARAWAIQIIEDNPAMAAGVTDCGRRLVSEVLLPSEGGGRKSPKEVVSGGGVRIGLLRCWDHGHNNQNREPQEI